MRLFLDQSNTFEQNVELKNKCLNEYKRWLEEREGESPERIKGWLTIREIELNCELDLFHGRTK